MIKTAVDKKIFTLLPPEEIEAFFVSAGFSLLDRDNASYFFKK